MIAPIIFVGAAVLSLVNSAVAAPSLALVKAPVTINIPKIVLAPRVLVGDAKCPIDNSEVRVMAAVKIDETATIHATEHLNVPGLLDQDLYTKATVVSDIDVCLCVKAGIQSNLIDIPVLVRDAARADIIAVAKTASDADIKLNALHLLLAKADVKIDLDLDVVSHIECKCPLNKTPTCINGKCGCK